MKALWILKVIVLAVLGVLVFGFITMHLWNFVVPDLFNGPVITFWQSLALLVLSKLLFSGIGGSRGGRCGEWKGKRYWHKRMEEKLSRMTPEEREKFKHEMRGRCGYKCDDVETALEK